MELAQKVAYFNWPENTTLWTVPNAHTTLRTPTSNCRRSECKATASIARAGPVGSNFGCEIGMFAVVVSTCWTIWTNNLTYMSYYVFYATWCNMHIPAYILTFFLAFIHFFFWHLFWHCSSFWQIFRHSFWLFSRIASNFFSGKSSGVLSCMSSVFWHSFCQ